MSKLPQIKRLAIEDFADQKSWIGKLLSPLNQFMDAVFQALNNQLTFSDNLSAIVKVISVPGLPTGTPYPIYFSWPLKAKPVGVWVVSAMEPSGVHSTFAAAVAVDWQYTERNQVQINSFPGLSTTTAYNVTIVAITG